MSISQGGTAARWNPVPEFCWITTFQCIIGGSILHFEGSKGKMCYKCPYKETYYCHVKKYEANFGPFIYHNESGERAKSTHLF